MKLGICFAGGGIKGVAHIGALKVFKDDFICYGNTQNKNKI